MLRSLGRGDATMPALAAIALLCLLQAPAVVAQDAVYQLLLTEGTGSDVPFEQRWTDPTIWQLLSGTDENGNGIPDTTDSIIVDRSALANGNTDLSNEGMPAEHSLTKLTGIGAGGGRDIVLKQLSNVTIGELEILPSGNPFVLFEERDQPLTINQLTGAGDLQIIRGGGFTGGTGVNRPDPNSGEDEIILFTGSTPSTYTGDLSLFNSNSGGAPGPQQAYFVADMVGAFGEAATLTLASTNVNSLEAELQFTANTTGGEGAIDDDATQVRLGSKASLNIDSGVNEVIGSGNLLTDIFGSGTFFTEADGTYGRLGNLSVDNQVSWIIGDGIITVGAAPSVDPLGDFNGDSIVDAADYTLWRDNEGGSDTILAANSSAGTGTIDADDYALWRANFGTTYASLELGGGGAVPEPSTVLLLASIVGLGYVLHRKS